jgi:VRR-NUC domain
MTKMLRMTEEQLAARKASNAKKPVVRVPTEHEEQCKVIEWCDQDPIAKKIFAIPNGSHKSPATAAKFKREGLRPGVPDLFLPVARRGFHGLFIEMKRTKGSVISDDQGKWIVQLGLDGYSCWVCRGADEAISVIQDYLKQ